MKTHIAFAALISTLAAITPCLAADTLVIYQNPYSYPVGTAGGNSGGEFTAVTSPGSFTGNYAPQTALNFGNGLGFETFCVQVDVQFNTAQTYTYTLAQTMQLDSSTQPLTKGAAYLYSLFATANPLLGYDYVDTATRFADAGLLQSAIWELEGGQSWSGDPFSPSNPYYNLALTQLGGAAIANSASAGAYGVDIVSLTDLNGAPAQDQLVYTGATAPDGGWTIALLGMGLCGMALTGPRLARVRV